MRGEGGIISGGERREGGIISGGEGRRRLGLKRVGRARMLESSRTVETGSVLSDRDEVTS